MIEFISWAKAMAAILITNSHFGNIYPYAQMANGGLLGNLLFFAVSGFCLYHIKQNFALWFTKRLIRIYPAVWIVTGICVALGFYSAISWSGYCSLFFYPTYYHFIASILVLYVPFYIIAKIASKSISPSKSIAYCGVLSFLAYLTVYFTIYDRSAYHIDTVEEPMILFVYFEAMLMGAWFRQNLDHYKNKNIRGKYLFLIATLIAYLASKYLLQTGTLPAIWQPLNQITIFVLLYSIFLCVASLDSKLHRLPFPIRRVIEFISGLTLEIYLVQYLILATFNIGLFPINACIVSLGILLSAFLVHQLSLVLISYIDRLFSPLSKEPTL